MEKPNIILHLKCFLKDLDNTNEISVDNIDSYKFPSKHNLSYDVIHNEDTTTIIDNNISHTSVSNNTLSNFASQKSNRIIHVINTNQSSSSSSSSLTNNTIYNPNYTLICILLHH
jgi:hypothetical protein